MAEDEIDAVVITLIAGVVKTLHLLRCCKFSIITMYLSTPK